MCNQATEPTISGRASGACLNDRKGRISVVFCIASFFPRPTGATHSAFRLAKSLRMLGVEVTFVLTNPYSEDEKVRDYGGFTTVYFDLQSPGKIRKIANLLRFSVFVIRYYRKFNIYHIHGGGHVNIFLAWWLKLLGKRSLLKVTLDGWDTPDGVGKLKWAPLLQRLYRKIPAIVVMTSGQEAKLRRYGYRGKVAVIPNGVDIEMFSPSSDQEKSRFREEQHVPKKSLFLCYAGYLGLVKGTDVLLQVWSKLSEKYNHLYLLLVGDYVHNDDDLEGAINRILAEARIDVSPLHLDRVFHIGHTNRLDYYLKNSDLFVFPSRQEGFGTVQIEAMSCGLPCVVNHIEGVTQDIFPNSEYGAVIRGNEIEDYLRTLSGFIEMEEQRSSVGNSARKRAVDLFSIDKVAQRCYAFYQEIIYAR